MILHREGAHCLRRLLIPLHGMLRAPWPYLLRWLALTPLRSPQSLQPGLEHHPDTRLCVSRANLTYVSTATRKLYRGVLVPLHSELKLSLSRPLPAQCPRSSSAASTRSCTMVHPSVTTPSIQAEWDELEESEYEYDWGVARGRGVRSELFSRVDTFGRRGPSRRVYNVVELRKRAGDA